MRGVGYTVYSAFQEIKEMNLVKKEPFCLVTQSTGNHGIAMIAALIKCLQFFPQLDFVHPVVFASKNIQIEKLNKMKHLLYAYRILVGNPNAGNVFVDYENYKEAFCARETFLKNNIGKYMSHGGKDIMTGHSSIGYEVHKQLLENNIGANQKISFYAAFGAGGPIGIGHSLQNLRKNTDLIAVQVDGLDSFIRSLKKGCKSCNNLYALDKQTAEIAEGIAVNCPEDDALTLSRKILTAGVVSKKCDFEEKHGLIRMSNIVYNVAKNSFVNDDTDVIVILDCESCNY